MSPTTLHKLQGELKEIKTRRALRAAEDETDKVREAELTKDLKDAQLPLE